MAPARAAMVGAHHKTHKTDEICEIPARHWPLLGSLHRENVAVDLLTLQEVQVQKLLLGITGVVV